jgi:hypothetical protein
VAVRARARARWKHAVCELFWSHELWAWSAAQLAEHYRRHQAAVDALAVQAGVRAWCLDAIDREQESR